MIMYRFYVYIPCFYPIPAITELIVLLSILSYLQISCILFILHKHLISKMEYLRCGSDGNELCNLAQTIPSLVFQSVFSPY